MTMEDNKEYKSLPMIPLRGLVAFPGNVFHFEAGRRKTIIALNQAMEKASPIFLLSQCSMDEDDPSFEHKSFYRVGVIAHVVQMVRVSKDIIRVVTDCIARARVTEVLQENPCFRVDVVTEPCFVEEYDQQCRAMMRLAINCFDRFHMEAALSEAEGYQKVRRTTDPNRLADYLAQNLPMEPEMAQEVLEERCAERRLQMLIAFMENEIELIRTENEIQDRVKKQMDKNQREYYLREQIKVISEELGDGDSPAAEAEEYRKRIEMLQLTDENAEKLLKECAKLSRMPFGSHEATVVRTYLDACIELPWNVTTTDRVDVAAAEKILDRDHYGLKKVKERILELLAVRQLQPDVRGQILCLVGPPGVGKTSIARSVAQAMNRKYVRVSLGGVHDEAEIRGHRKTYIGAMPGRIMAAVKQAGSMNPLILLDEIDKLGGDFRGDPASALLEVLDPEQNVSFHDHYIDLPFDLSHALFITTANDEGAIPGPLRDRMEVIRIPGYTLEEKVHIALEHLYPNQLKKNGLDRRRVKLSEEALRGLIDGYTREAGVRNLERMLGSLCRKAARKIVSGETKTVKIGMEELEPLLGPALFTSDDLNTMDQVGVCNGLAWTAVGGEMLQVEVALMEGAGKLELTGSLGDVMKESARIAISCVRTLAPKLGVDGEFYKKLDIHIHVPEGAVPKDGPSAGVTLTTALVSALTDNPVRGDVAMTGEVTLRGRVLPIGGLREKAMAAYTHKMKTVLIPKGNAPHVAEVDDAVKAGLEFVPVESILQVLQTALVNPIGAQPQDAGK